MRHPVPPCESYEFHEWNDQGKCYNCGWNRYEIVEISLLTAAAADPRLRTDWEQTDGRLFIDLIKPGRRKRVTNSYAIEDLEKMTIPEAILEGERLKEAAIQHLFEQN